MAAEYLEFLKNQRLSNSNTGSYVTQLLEDGIGEGNLWRIHRYMAQWWQLFVPVNYVKPAVEYTKQHYIFQLTKRTTTQQWLNLLILRVTMAASRLLK